MALSARTQVFIAISISVASLVGGAANPGWAAESSAVGAPTPSQSGGVKALGASAPMQNSVRDGTGVGIPVPDDAALTINPARALGEPSCQANSLNNSFSSRGGLDPNSNLNPNPNPNPNLNSKPSGSGEVPAIAALVNNLKLEGWRAVTSGPKTDGDPDRALMLNEFGCRISYPASFQRGQRLIVATVYCFNSSQGAYGAYTLLRRGSSTAVSKGDASSEDDQSVSIWKDRFFISVFGTSEDDDESKEAVNKIAMQLSKAIVSHGELPQIIMRLPNMDRVRATEKVAMGPASARKFFPAPSLNALSFANSYGAGIADYAFQAPVRERLKLMMTEYANPAAAQQAYEKYVAAVEEQHPNVVPDAGTSRAIFKLANSYMMCELRTERILMISGARKKNAPLILSRQIL